MMRRETKGPRIKKHPRARKKICAFCAEKSDFLDYKNFQRLRRFVSDRGKILSRRHSGNCAKHQRVVAEAVKRARFMALLPYVAEQPH
jgi:small subunit ribosomal protein S18